MDKIKVGDRVEVIGDYYYYTKSGATGTVTRCIDCEGDILVVFDLDTLAHKDEIRDGDTEFLVSAEDVKVVNTTT